MNNFLMPLLIIPGLTWMQFAHADDELEQYQKQLNYGTMSESFSVESTETVDAHVDKAMKKKLKYERRSNSNSSNGYLPLLEGAAVWGLAHPYRHRPGPRGFGGPGGPGGGHGRGGRPPR